MKRTGDDTLRCSFCHKSQEAVDKLISSSGDDPRAYICGECIAVCNSILEDERPSGSPGRLPKWMMKLGRAVASHLKPVRMAGARL